MNSRKGGFSTIAALILAAFSVTPGLAGPPTGPADVIYVNGKIATLDPSGTIAEAVAVKDGRFEAVGTSDAIRKLSGPTTRKLDLEGRLVVPGLIDAHTHPMETLMMKESWVDARFPGTSSVTQALANIEAWSKHTPKGAWIFVACVSASENKFEERRLPSRAELDAVAPDNPVVLANGTHMAVVNSMALRMLGVTKDDVELKGGGRALLGDNGEPNGTLTDAMGAVPTTHKLSCGRLAGGMALHKLEPSRRLPSVAFSPRECGLGPRADECDRTRFWLWPESAPKGSRLGRPTARTRTRKRRPREPD